jgi:hypothetical protein
MSDFFDVFKFTRFEQSLKTKTKVSLKNSAGGFDKLNHRHCFILQSLFAYCSVKRKLIPALVLAVLNDDEISGLVITRSKNARIIKSLVN